MSVLERMLFFIFFISITIDLSRIVSRLDDILKILGHWNHLNEIDRMEKRVEKRVRE